MKKNKGCMIPHSWLRSYYSFGKKDPEKQAIDEALKRKDVACTFSLNPRFLEKVQKGFCQYIMCIDARRSDYYFKLRNYLQDNQMKYSSFITVGDSDFIVEYYATEKGDAAFKEDVLALLDKAPHERTVRELIQHFTVTQNIMVKNMENENLAPDLSGISRADLLNIPLLQRNYRDPSLIAKFGGGKKIANFLERLKQKNVIFNYYLTHKCSNEAIRLHIFIVYSDVGFERVLLEHKEIKAKIIDIYRLKASRNEDKFYDKVDFLITGEFASIKEYCNWKETLYKVAQEEDQNINVMTYVVERTISDNPTTLGDRALFERICESYDVPGSLPIGSPFYLNEEIEDRRIGLSIEALQDHGLIVGEPGDGKTFTSSSLVSKLFERGIRVHVVDATGGFTTKFKEVRPDLYDQIEIVDLSVPEPFLSTLSKPPKVNVYAPKESEFNVLARTILENIRSGADVKDRITKDVVIFEEARDLFSVKETKEAIFSTTRMAGRKGASLWFSTQNLSSFPVSGNSLISDLRNRIIHRMAREECEAATRLLSEGIAESIYDDIGSEVVSLQTGEVIVSFVDRSNDEKKQLSPIKIKIKSK